MEWRCEWCGKPHADDDPPCDNCGHGTFERAVVQEPAVGANDSTTLWVCTECGREHPKHAPPCSRCGNATLERREQTVDESELQAPGYRDLVTPRYLVGLAAALLLGTVLLLGVAGVVDLPGMNTGVPAVQDVPGEADTYEGISLAAVESGYVDAFNEELERTGGDELREDERLTAVARFYNQRRVKAAVGSGEVPSDEQLVDLLSESCESAPARNVGTMAVPESVESGEALGRSIAAAELAEGDIALRPGTTRTGVDVHVVENRLYVTQFAC